MLDPLALSTPLSSTFSGPAVPSRPRRALLTPHPTEPDSYYLRLTSSLFESFLICQRRGENKLVHAREAQRDQSAMQFGTLFHKLEARRLSYGGSCLPDLVAEHDKQDRELILSHFSRYPHGPEDHRTPARMIEVWDKYTKLYANDGWPEKVVKDREGDAIVERAFELPLCTAEVNAEIPYGQASLVQGTDPEFIQCFPVRSLHVLWCGTLDALLSDSSFLWIVDHKTTSSGGKEFESAFHLSRQTVGYAWAAEQILGRPVTGCLINEILIRPPAKTARATKADTEFNRLNFFYDKDRIQEWYTSMQYSAADFVGSLVRGFFPLTGPRSFKSPCAYCDYESNCRLPIHQRGADLSSALYRDVTDYGGEVE